MPTLTTTTFTTDAYVLIEADWSDVTDAYIPGGLNLSGMNGYYASTPDRGAVDITGDIDIRADVTCNWTLGSDQALVSKYTIAGNERGYLLQIDAAGTLSLYWSNDGTATLVSTSTASPTPNGNGRLAVKATLDVDDGGGNHVVEFFTAPDISGPWTQLGATVTTAGTTSIFNNSQDVLVGSFELGASALLVGTVHSVQIRNGIDGLVVAFPRFDEQPTGTIAFTDEVGSAWSLAGEAYISAASNPIPEYVSVFRVDDATGESEQIPGYVCVDENGCLPLSCDGLAYFWDTTPPLNTSFHYETFACPAYELCEVEDSFTRIVADDWGVAPTGQAWSSRIAAPPNAADYDVDGANGTMAVNATAVTYFTLIDTGFTDMDVTALFIPPAIATGSDYFAYVAARADDFDNTYLTRVEYDTSGLATLRLAKIVGGSFMTIAPSFDLGVYSAGEPWYIRIRVFGSTIQGMAWRMDEDRPDWQQMVVDTSLTTGTTAGTRAAANPGNTNVPFIARWDDFSACEACVDPTEVTSASSPSDSIENTDTIFLKSLMEPCLDIIVDGCEDPVGCPDPTDAIAYGGTYESSYGANTAVLYPVNRKYPIPINRQRRGASATLILITATCSDRDAVLAINDSGDPLFFQAPERYCIPDRYITVGGVGEDTIGVDQQVQNRVFGLPYVEVERPEGPVKGPCGVQFANQCDTYPTWDDMVSGGITYADMITGGTSPNGPS